MAIQKWSDEVLLVTPPQDPGFTEDMNEVVDRLGNDKPAVVVDLKEVEYLNSSNLSLLLRLRKRLLNHTQPLLLCNINTKLWSTFLVTGLEALFSFSDDVTTALTSLQADRQNG
ncbi:MAG: STAS domain-containing protein [Anaerolineaceae bacterium]|nr:STAS domain-containing protein [Anaerolineaceae bacterium]